MSYQERWASASVPGVSMIVGSTMVLLLLCAASAYALESDVTTVLYLDRAVEVEETLSDPSDLWVSPLDLTRVNDFVLKPEGACLDDLCIPVNQDADSDVVVRREGKKWFSLTAFAERLGQEFLVDRETDTWSFGSIAVMRASFVQQAQAPEFTLPDREGNLVSLSDFRGRKVMILSWASW